MFPLIGRVTRFEQQDDRFSASVDVKVPEDVSHLQLDTEVFGSAAHAVPLSKPRNVQLANISVHGPGCLKIQVGDEMRVMCFKTGELPEECIASVHRSRGASSRFFRSDQRAPKPQDMNPEGESIKPDDEDGSKDIDIEDLDFDKTEGDELKQ
jgi:hypothetical protein